MIGIIGFDGAPPSGCEHLAALPDPQAPQWSSFLIHCRDPESVVEVVEWLVELRATRMHAPVGMTFTPLARYPVRIALRTLRNVVYAELGDGSIPDERLVERLRKKAVEGALLERWHTRWPEMSPEVDRILHVIAAQGTRGRLVATVATKLGTSRSTLHRRLQALDAPGRLCREARTLAERFPAEGAAAR